MSTNQKTKEFTGLRSILFPVHFHELGRFIPMALMMLFVLFNYTVLRNAKDSLVVNAAGSGAEIISFIKLWGTTPSAILFVIFYNRLSGLFDREKRFYLCIAPFLLFFGLFAALIYPNLNILHPSIETIQSLQEQFPRFKWFIAMGGNWSFALFYILAELWGSVVLSLLFWGFANETTAKDQAKRFYPLYGCIANVGLIFAGRIGQYFSNLGKMAPEGVDPWQYSLNFLMSAVVVSGLCLLALYYYLNRHFDKNPPVTEQSGAPKKKKKPKLSLGESLRYLMSSPHLLCIALMVFAYGITINFIDVLWKGQVKIFYAGDTNAFNAYMASFSEMTGWIALPLMLLGGNVLRRFTWKQAALVTPTIVAIAGVGFFSAVYFGSFSEANTPLFYAFGTGVTAVGLAVQLGFWQNSITKATKYSLFDPTKEMAYMPLDEELRNNGKAAVDVVGGRAGKSGGSLTFVILQTILPAFSLVQLTPFLGVVFVVILAAWYAGVFRLNNSLTELQKEKEEAELAEAV